MANSACSALRFPNEPSLAGCDAHPEVLNLPSVGGNFFVIIAKPSRPWTSSPFLPLPLTYSTAFLSSATTVGASSTSISPGIPRVVGSSSSYVRRSPTPPNQWSGEPNQQPSSPAFNDCPLLVRDAVQLVNQLVDFGVGRGDFALQAVQFRGRELTFCRRFSDRFWGDSDRLINYAVGYPKAEVPPELSDQGFWLSSETVLV